MEVKHQDALIKHQGNCEFRFNFKSHGCSRCRGDQPLTSLPEGAARHHFLRTP